MSALANQCAQLCCDERKFADSGEMCSGIVTLGLVHAMVLAQEGKDNRPHSTHYDVLIPYDYMTKLGFHSLSLAFLYRFSSNFTWKGLV